MIAHSSSPATVIIKLRIFFFSLPASYRLANYKALAEHQEQQVTKLKEELRRAHQQHDITGKFKTNIRSSMLNIQF